MAKLCPACITVAREMEYLCVYTGGEPMSPAAFYKDLSYESFKNNKGEFPGYGDELCGLCRTGREGA